jgi:hypothetical protein
MKKTDLFLLPSLRGNAHHMLNIGKKAKITVY